MTMSRVILCSMMVGVTFLAYSSEGPVAVQKRGSLHSSTEGLRGSRDGLKRSGARAISVIKSEQVKRPSSFSASPDEYDHVLPFHGCLKRNSGAYSPTDR